MKLSDWESIVITMALSFLSVVQSKITNPTELAGLQAATAFLQKLLAGSVQAS